MLLAQNSAHMLSPGKHFCLANSWILSQEPELLKAEGDRVQRQMQEVAVGHYRSFITAAQAVREIRSEIQNIDSHLGKLVRGLTDSCTGVAGTGVAGCSACTECDRARAMCFRLTEHPLFSWLTAHAQPS